MPCTSLNKNRLVEQILACYTAVLSLGMDTTLFIVKIDILVISVTDHRAQQQIQELMGRRMCYVWDRMFMSY